MNKRLIGTALSAAVALSCSQAMTAEQKIEMLESQRLEILSDLHRQKAECEAQAIEFSTSPERVKVVSACLDSHRKAVEIAQRSLADIDKRISEIRREKPSLAQFSGKLDAEK